MNIYFQHIALILSRSLEKSERNKHCNILKINTALQYIAKNCHRPISSADVSKQCNIPIRTLDRMFHKALGITLVGYINDMKLKKAAELLLDGQYRIIDIASMLSFSDSCYFSKMFKKSINSRQDNIANRINDTPVSFLLHFFTDKRIRSEPSPADKISNSRFSLHRQPAT